MIASARAFIIILFLQIVALVVVEQRQFSRDPADFAICPSQNHDYGTKPAPWPTRLFRRPRCGGAPRLSEQTSTTGRARTLPQAGPQSGESLRPDLSAFSLRS